LMFSGIASVFHLMADLLLFGTEFLVIVSLFYGLSHMDSRYLRPYLVFELLRNLLLLLLFLFCLMELMQRRDRFLHEIIAYASQFIDVQPTEDIEYSYYDEWVTRRTGNDYQVVGVKLATLLLVVLGLIIVIGLWFLHTVLMAYLFLEKRQKTIIKDYMKDAVDNNLCEPHDK